ncbi:MAG: beta-ribofuranosylaminobenzene 5'-phosphate synthase family protein [Fimbriiglobus sp.]
MTRVVAPSRLHFGLLHVPVPGLTHWPDGLPVRAFGGLGLMIDQPGLEVRAEPADEWAAAGPHADRALGFARQIVEARPSWFGRLRFRVNVVHAPPEHVGLGVGTQLGLAVARAVTESAGVKNLSGPDLAAGVGRGGRSAVGVHGFDRGGFVFDCGRPLGDGLSTLAGRYDFPRDWWVVVCYPQAGSGWSGAAERAAFARPRSIDAALRLTERLVRLAAVGVVPALLEEDYPAFAGALYEYNRIAGEPFASDQGGTYSSPEVAELVRRFRQDWHVPGVGQSSWGPAVFAVVPGYERAHHLCEQVRAGYPDGLRLVACPANSTGAVVS